MFVKEKRKKKKCTLGLKSERVGDKEGSRSLKPPMKYQQSAVVRGQNYNLTWRAERERERERERVREKEGGGGRWNLF
jgi:hypothetical protein